MARRISSSSTSPGILCSTRRILSLSSLPVFGDTKGPQDFVVNETAFQDPNTSSIPAYRDTYITGGSPNVNPDSQCYLSTDRWQHMNERFFSGRVPLELLGSGLVGEVWYEQVCDSMGRIQPIITKTYDFQSPSGTLGLHLELYLYSSWEHLRPLQGMHVPCVIGAFSTSGGKIALAMESPSRTGWREASMSDTDEVKEKASRYAIIAAYKAIHCQGVLHNDVELRHILISDEGQVQIIDWQMARSIKPCDAVQLQLCTRTDLELEARKVKVLLDYQGAYARELERVSRLLQNDDEVQSTRKHDPCLKWFSFYEIVLMTDGYWTKPDPDYTGGRSILAPSLSCDYAGPSGAQNATWPKCQCGDYTEGINGESIDSRLTTTVPPPTLHLSTQHDNDGERSRSPTKMDTSVDFPPSPWSPGIKGVAPAPVPAAPQSPRVPEAMLLPRRFGYKIFFGAEPTMGEGTPSGRSQLPQPLLPPRWCPAPHHAMKSFPKPRGPFVIERERTLPRSTYWMYASHDSMPKSPLNNTNTRATLPNRPRISLEGAAILEQRPQRANALRAFGSLLPGSTPESYRLSVPAARGPSGRQTLPRPNFTPLKLSQPLPVATQNLRRGLAELTLEMTYSRRLLDSEEMESEMTIALHRLRDDIASTAIHGAPAPPTLERWASVLRNADIVCLHTRKIARIFGDPRHSVHAKGLLKLISELRLSISKYQRGSSSIISPTEGTHRPTRRPFMSLGNDASAPETGSQPARGPRLSDTAYDALQKILFEVTSRPPPSPEPELLPSQRRAIRRTQFGLASASADPSKSSAPVPLASATSVPQSTASIPQPSSLAALQPAEFPSLFTCAYTSTPVDPPKSPTPSTATSRRARKPPPVPSTRILRSMSKTGESIRPVLNPAASASGPSLRTPLTIRKPRVDLTKAKQKHATRNEGLLPTQPVPTQSRYNLRPRKRDLDITESGSQAGVAEPSERPTKRHHA